MSERPADAPTRLGHQHHRKMPIFGSNPGEEPLWRGWIAPRQHTLEERATTGEQGVGSVERALQVRCTGSGRYIRVCVERCSHRRVRMGYMRSIIERER